MYKLIFLAAALLGTGCSEKAVSSGWSPDKALAYFPMELGDGQLREEVGGRSFELRSRDSRMGKPGAVGNAVRFDGYSTYAICPIDDGRLNQSELGISLWCAAETYPMIGNDQAVEGTTFIAGNLYDANRSGFAVTLSAQGYYGIEFYASGTKVSCKAPDKLPKGEWVHIAASVTAKEVVLYKNGEEAARTAYSGFPDFRGGDLIVGKSFEIINSGPFALNIFNGLIDEIVLYARALTPAELSASPAPQHGVDFTPDPGRFSGDIQRPQLHGMPVSGWTNETHGLTFYDGNYHVFFQKNANGPYFGRLHWGHLKSPDLVRWEELPIAIGPSEPYDIKGAWSGCILNDEQLTGGKPHIVYSAADNQKVSIAMARPLDDGLVKWQKYGNNPVIAGRPDGLSADFRDPHMFKHNGRNYMIVGTSKEGKGAVTLHRYDPASGVWSNNGDIFFSAVSRQASGEFWEMPAIERITEDKWIFVATPLGPAQGVEIQYWIGTINEDGTFEPLPKYRTAHGVVELDAMGQDGYGMLSPSLLRKDGRLVAMGIVPDKLPGAENLKLGWAHLYSFPRVWSLDAEDNLVQRPHENLEILRTSTKLELDNISVDGARSLVPVNGRVAEIDARFEIGTQERFGFNLYKNGDNQVKLYYEPASNRITVDARDAQRIVNDSHLYNGLYRDQLPKTLRAGDELRLHVFMDNSIMDIFINECWAFSVRVFPTDPAATGMELFSEGGAVKVRSCRAWELKKP